MQCFVLFTTEYVDVAMSIGHLRWSTSQVISWVLGYFY
jgi:hypothetical protein